MTTKLAHHLVAVRLAGEGIAGDTFLRSLSNAFPESPTDVSDIEWLRPASAGIVWHATLNVNTIAPNFGPPVLEEPATLDLTGQRTDIQIVLDELSRSFHETIEYELPVEEGTEVRLQLSPMNS